MVELPSLKSSQTLSDCALASQQESWCQFTPIWNRGRKTGRLKFSCLPVPVLIEIRFAGLIYFLYPGVCLSAFVYEGYSGHIIFATRRHVKHYLSVGFAHHRTTILHIHVFIFEHLRNSPVVCLSWYFYWDYILGKFYLIIARSVAQYTLSFGCNCYLNVVSTLQT